MPAWWYRNARSVWSCLQARLNKWMRLERCRVGLAMFRSEQRALMPLMARVSGTDPEVPKGTVRRCRSRSLDHIANGTQ